MKCYLCSKKAIIKQHKNRYICDKCFCRLFEKRIRKFTRINKVFTIKDRLLVIGDVNRYLAKNIMGKLPIRLCFRTKVNDSFIKKNRINKILIEYTLDDEISAFLVGLFKNKKIKEFNKKYIKLLKVVTDDEVKKFARLRKLKFKPNKKDHNVQKFLDKLSARYPSVKYGLLKNIEKLKRLNKF